MYLLAWKVLSWSCEEFLLERLRGRGRDGGALSRDTCLWSHTSGQVCHSYCKELCLLLATLVRQSTLRQMWHSWEKADLVISWAWRALSQGHFSLTGAFLAMTVGQPFPVRLCRRSDAAADSAWVPSLGTCLPGLMQELSWLRGISSPHSPMLLPKLCLSPLQSKPLAFHLGKTKCAVGSEMCLLILSLLPLGALLLGNLCCLSLRDRAGAGLHSRHSLQYLYSRLHQRHCPSLDLHQHLNVLVVSSPASV